MARVAREMVEKAGVDVDELVRLRGAALRPQ
jgi:ferritin-like protein